MCWIPGKDALPSADVGNNASRILHRVLRVAALLAASGFLLAPDSPEGAFDFVRRGAIHNTSARYRLPFVLKVPRLMTQGPWGRRSHDVEPNVQAFDFVMPIGSQVLAARRGTVVRVRDGAKAGGLDVKQEGNNVFVRHPDGTVAFYGHLHAGIPVREGQKVRLGDLLAYSGNTGYSGAPHLHFSVWRRSQADDLRSVPIRFGVGSAKGYVPKDNQFYGSPPKPNAKLHIYLGDREFGSKRLRVSAGSEPHLRIVVEDAAGKQTDVSDDPRTELATMTPWSVDVVDGRRILMRPAKGFDFSDLAKRKGLDLSEATVAVFHGNKGDPLVAIGKVDFRVVGLR